MNGARVWSIGGGIESSMLSQEAGAGEDSEVLAGFVVGLKEGKGVVDVGAVLMWCSMSAGTVCGVTFSTMVKDGRRRMVVGSE